jgi:hypothetical protein
MHVCMENLFCPLQSLLFFYGSATGVSRGPFYRNWINKSALLRLVHGFQDHMQCVLDSVAESPVSHFSDFLVLGMSIIEILNWSLGVSMKDCYLLD